MLREIQQQISTENDLIRFYVILQNKTVYYSALFIDKAESIEFRLPKPWKIFSL